jgi:cytidylate kinase
MRIAISGYSGCGNTTATKNVGDALKLKVVNYTFRDLAKDLGLNFDFIQAQAETNLVYDYLTDLVQIRQALIHDDIIIGTRLAAWLIEAELRIWLHAPLEARASRISLRESSQGITYEHTLYKTLKRDEYNRKRYLRLYGINIEDHSDFDIIINTDQLSASQVSGLIVAAAQWAEGHGLERRHVHSARIQKILSENLKVDFDKLKDPNWELSIPDIYRRVPQCLVT